VLLEAKRSLDATENSIFLKKEVRNVGYMKEDLLKRFPQDRKIDAFLMEAKQQLPHLPVLVDVS
jgi:hypothetical protein